MAKAIKQYPMGLYSKIFFQFKSEENGGPGKFWDDTQMMLSAFSTMEWFADYAPVWQSLDLPMWLPDSRIFFVTLLGDRALSVHQSSVSDDDIITQILPVFNQIYGKVLLSKLGRPLDASDIDSFSMTRWVQDPLYRGMFTNWHVNATWVQQEEYRHERGNVYMSGEGTCFRYNGYVHGALLSGRRTALNLLSQQYGFTNTEQSICDVVPPSGANAPNHVVHGRGFPRHRPLQ